MFVLAEVGVLAGDGLWFNADPTILDWVAFLAVANVGLFRVTGDACSSLAFLALGCLWEGSLEGTVVDTGVGLVGVVDPKKYEKHESVGK